MTIFDGVDGIDWTLKDREREREREREAVTQKVPSDMPARDGNGLDFFFLRVGRGCQRNKWRPSLRWLVCVRKTVAADAVSNRLSAAGEMFQQQQQNKKNKTKEWAAKEGYPWSSASARRCVSH